MALAKPLQQIDRTYVLMGKRRLTYFGGCDYYRLASHPAVLRAVTDGLKHYGLNVSASRITTGNHRLYVALERELTTFFRVERAALFASGYVTNSGFAQAFAGHFTHAVIDERAHGSLRDAAMLLGAPVVTFQHRDVASFKSVVKACGRRARLLVMTDGLFSHDGSCAPLGAYLDALPATGMLLVDDTHGAGVLGKRGRGTPEWCGVVDQRLVQTITLSKAFGVYGGAVLGSAPVVAAIQERSRAFIGNTPLPLPLANGALQALRLLRKNGAFRKRLNANIGRIKNQLKQAGWTAPMLESPAPIVCVTPRGVEQARQLECALLKAGIFPSLIRYASTSSYFRFAISSEHSPAQLTTLGEVLIRHL